MIPEWNFFHKNKNFIQSENQKDLCGNEMLFQYHVEKHMEMEWTGFRMKVILALCE